MSGDFGSRARPSATDDFEDGDQGIQGFGRDVPPNRVLELLLAIWCLLHVRTILPRVKSLKAADEPQKSEFAPAWTGGLA